MMSLDNEKISADPIYESLKAAIVSGALAPGEPLRQEEIARSHGVSKIPVREALLRLEVDGLVQFRKNKGAIVRYHSTEEILNLMDIRSALECKALELAVPNIIESDIAAARAVLDTYSHETTAEAWSALNRKFHDCLYEPCANHLLLEMIHDVGQRMGPTIRNLVSETSGLKRPHDEHAAILDAVAAGETDRAVDLLRRHIDTTRKEIAARLRRRPQG